MEERKDDKSFEWVQYGNYFLQPDFLYKNVDISNLLRAKVIHSIDPSDTELNRICIEFSSTELLEVKLSLDEVRKRYEKQLDFSMNYEGNLNEPNHLLLIHKIISFKGNRGEEKIRVIAEGIQDTSLRKKIDNQQEPLDEPAATKIFAQLFRALEQLSKEGTKLLQLHPGFIFFDLQGNVKLSPVVPLKEKGWKIRSYINLDEESGNKELGLHRMLWNLGVIYFEMLLKKLPWGESSIPDFGYPQPPEANIFEDMTRELPVNHQEILKKLLRIGDSKVVNELIKDVENFLHDQALPDDISNSQEPAPFSEKVEELRKHTGFACTVCGKQDFSGARFGNLSKGNESKSVCSCCFRELGKDEKHQQNFPFDGAFLRIDRSYFSLQSAFNKAGSLLAIIKTLIKEDKDSKSDVYNFACSECKQKRVITDLKRFSGNPFICLCSCKVETDVSSYLNEPDRVRGSGYYHYYDLNPNTPTFTCTQYKKCNTNPLFKLPYGEIYHAFKAEVDKSGPKFLDFIQNLKSGTIIKYPINSGSEVKQSIKNQFVNQTYTKLRNLYMGNLLQYYSVDVDSDHVSLLIEPLGSSWKPLLENLENSQPSNAEEIVNLMILICKCVENLHSLGIPHGHLSLDLFLSGGAMYTHSTVLKLTGLELLDFEPFLKPKC